MLRFISKARIFKPNFRASKKFYNQAPVASQTIAGKIETTIPEPTPEREIPQTVHIPVAKPSITITQRIKNAFRGSLFQELAQTIPTRKYLLKDTIAGINIASIVLPLSLAIAVASGVPPSVALVSSIIGGVIASLFGGSTLSVSGPAAAMSIVVYNIVATQGLGGLMVATFVAGLLQMTTGFLKCGKFVRLIPSPIIHGFITGIGAIIFVKQLPNAVGITLANEGGLLPSVIYELGSRVFYEYSGVTIGLTALTLGVTYAFKKLFPAVKSLAPLVGVGTCGAVNYFGGLGAAVIGNVPNSIPLPQLFHVQMTALPTLIGHGALLFALLSLESLLSCAAVDALQLKREKNAVVKEPWLRKRYDPNQELIGQGLANTIVPFFSGMPVTSVVVRSSVNVESGGMTRRGGIVHSLALLACVLAFAPVISHLPYAALAAVLLQVSKNMMDPKTLAHVWRTNKYEAFPFLATTAGMCFVGMIEAVGIGTAIYLATLALRKGIKAFEVSNYKIEVPSEKIMDVTLVGPVNFVSVPKLAKMQDEIMKKIRNDMMIQFHMEKVKEIDITGTESLVSIFEEFSDYNCKLSIFGASGAVKHNIEKCKPKELEIQYINE
jgi:carbonic anhydrase